MRASSTFALAAAVAALALAPISISSAHPEPSPKPKPAPKPAPTDGFVGQRPWLSSFSDADQKLLASLIDKYTSANDNAVIKVHENTMNNPAQQNVHYRNFAQLFTFHHGYVGGLEDYLKAQGYPQFVPLPKWNPSEPIPTIFGYHNGKKVIKNFKPNIDWSAFVETKLGAYQEDVTSGPSDTLPDAKILANTLVVPHNNTHNTIGGIMLTMSSPTAPIFWCYHAFIDDIWYDWQKVQKNKPKTDAAMLEATPYDPTATRSVDGTVRVDKDGNVFLDRVGTSDSFPVTDEPWKTILSADNGKTLWVQGKIDASNNLAIDNLIATNDSMGPIKMHSDAALTAPQSGTLTGMSEIHVTGQDGDFWKVRSDDTGATGFVAKSVVQVGKSPADSSMGNMPGMNMPGMSMPATPAAPATSTTAPAGGSTEKVCACCGTGASCTCCGGTTGAASGASGTSTCACGMDMGNKKQGPEDGITDGVKKAGGE